MKEQCESPRRSQIWMAGVVRDGFPEGVTALVRSEWKRVPSRDRKELSPFMKLQECQNGWSMVNKKETGGQLGSGVGKGSDYFRVWRPSKEFGFYS